MKCRPKTAVRRTSTRSHASLGHRPTTIPVSQHCASILTRSGCMWCAESSSIPPSTTSSGTAGKNESPISRRRCPSRLMNMANPHPPRADSQCHNVVGREGLERGRDRRYGVRSRVRFVPGSYHPLFAHRSLPPIWQAAPVALERRVSRSCGFHPPTPSGSPETENPYQGA